MDINEVPTSHKRWTFHFNCEWLSLFDRRCSWSDFTFIRADVEHDRMFGGINWTFALLGFYVHGGYCYNPECEGLKRIDSMMKEFDEGRKNSQQRSDTQKEKVD